MVIDVLIAFFGRFSSKAVHVRVLEREEFGS